MKLEDLLDSYFNNPSEELKELIMNTAKKTSRMAIINSISQITNAIDTDEENKELYIDISKMLLDEVASEDVRNFRIDEDGFFREVTEPKKR